jgi:hypothetical protein
VVTCRPLEDLQAGNLDTPTKVIIFLESLEKTDKQRRYDMMVI